jgi:hypothetical protein
MTTLISGQRCHDSWENGKVHILDQIHSQLQSNSDWSHDADMYLQAVVLDHSDPSRHDVETMRFHVFPAETKNIILFIFIYRLLPAARRD